MLRTNLKVLQVEKMELIALPCEHACIIIYIYNVMYMLLHIILSKPLRLFSKYFSKPLRLVCSLLSLIVVHYARGCSCMQLMAYSAAAIPMPIGYYLTMNTNMSTLLHDLI